MNFSELNTPAELVAANGVAPEPTPTEVVKSLLFELEAPEALDVLKEAVSHLALWHQSRAAEADTTSQAAVWACDEGRLHICLLALNEVTF